MPTLKQQKLAKLRLENPHLEKGELVELGGYSPAVIKTPAKALESKGYKEALAQYGLTEELVTTALVEDIENKPNKRVNELALAADILGMKKGGGTTNNIVIIRPSDEEMELVERALEDMFNGGQADS
jgi:hypothetical protein